MFNNEELIVWIGVVLRRMNKGIIVDKNNIFWFKDLVLDSENYIVIINDEFIEFIVKEYRILELLISNFKKVFIK